MRWRSGVVLLLMLAAAARVWRLSDLPFTVFDETHYATLAAQYLSGRPFIFPHPPASALLFAALAWFSSVPFAGEYAEQLAPYGDFPYVLLRTSSALAGTLLVFFIMLLARATTGSTAAGLIAGLLAALDNMLVLYSRLILPDIFLLTYGTAGLLCFLQANRPDGRRHRSGWLLTSGILFGLAGAVKVTGFIFPAAAFVYATVLRPDRDYAVAVRLVRYLIVVPAAIGIILMLVHFSLLNPTGTVYLGADSIATDMLDAVREQNPLYRHNQVLGRVSQRLAETVIGYLFTIGYHFDDIQHLAGSPWWMWPYGLKPLPLFAARVPGDTFRMMFITANPVIWWSGLAALAYLIPRRIRQGRANISLDLMFAGYFLYLFVMALIQRTMFIYHYLPALVFLIPLTALALAKLHTARPLMAAIILASTAASFIYFAPYTYGLPPDRYWTPVVLGGAAYDTIH